MNTLIILIAGLTEVLNTTSRLLNAAMGMYVGSLEASFINHVVGSLFAGALILVGIGSNASFFQDISFIYYLGGMIGFLMLSANNYSTLHLGAMLVYILFVSTQLFTSGIIEHFGLIGAPEVPFTLKRFLGISLIIAGAFLVSQKKTLKRK
ncbi:MAG: DMT family transporter [bacterium]|nr:DMT family transporter [bacterium]MBU1918664.1 DMT family transporter [bacterium]